MADILIDNQIAPSTPAASKSVIWVDSTTKKLVQTDDAGKHYGAPLSRNQYAGASFALTSVDTYVTNSGLLIPSFGLQAGTMARWFINLSKTAAGTTASTVTIQTGANQTTADTDRLVLTQTIAPAATACSTQLIVTAYVAVAGASGILACQFGFTSGSLAFGSGKDAQSGAFDMTGLAGSYLSLSANPNTASVWTCTGVWAELVG